MASEQIRVKQAVSKPLYQPQTSGTLSYTRQSNQITVKGADFEAVFKDGVLTAYNYDGKVVINSPLKFSAFRLPTDNDKVMTEQWDKMGLRHMEVSGITMNVSQSDDKQTVNIQTTAHYQGNGKTAFDITQNYTILSDGAIVVNNIINPAELKVTLPRMGFCMEMPAGFENFTYYGRGPGDNYLDRKESCFPGIYKSTVSAQLTNFVLPQENGNHEDTRWMALTDSDGLGLMVVAPSLMGVSVAHWRPEDNYINRNSRAKHPYQMVKCTNTIVNIDAANRALGNASCGPNVLDKYELRADKRIFTFLLLPLTQHLSDTALLVKGRVASPVCAPVVMSRDKEGLLTLTTATPGATIHYTINGGNTNNYDGALSFANGGIVTAWATADGLEQSIETTVSFGVVIDKTGWRIVSCDSQQGGSEAVENAIDDDFSTIWHTAYNVRPIPGCPHEVVVDFGQQYTVNAFSYTGRSDGNNGHVKGFEVYFNNSLDDWGTPAATGTFENTSSMQTVAITGKPNARYMKFVITSVYSNEGYASVAELDINADALPTKIGNLRASQFGKAIAIGLDRNTFTVTAEGDSAIHFYTTDGTLAQEINGDGSFSSNLNIPDGVHMMRYSNSLRKKPATYTMMVKQ